MPSGPRRFSLLAAAGVNIGALIAGHVHRRVPVRHQRTWATRWSRRCNQRDYLVVQGITLVVAIAYVVLQFIIDFVFTVVDPRVTQGVIDA